jgi:16S rRNA (adenine1518-N6/adenine1519-N6)-dimethyltransferase
MIPKKPDEVPVVDFALFSSVVANAFGQRRKTLRNALSQLLSQQDIESAGVNPAARAETLRLDEFVALAEKAAALGVKPVTAGAAPE